MTTFKTLPKKQLRSGAHFTEMEAFNTRLQAAAFTPAKLTQLTKQFAEALAEEDKYLKQTIASAYSRQLADTDAERDRVYMLLKQTVNLWAASSFDEQATAAGTLKRIVDIYKVDIHDQYDQETGLLTNLITDLELPANAAHVQTLGLSAALTKLKEYNEQMKTLMASRADERSTKITGALKAARTAVNALYDQLTRLIESYSETADDAMPYETFITEWNTEIDRIRQQCASRKSAAKAGTGAEK